MMHVQKYLETHTYEDLEKEFGIQVNQYDDRVSLNYHQIDSYSHKFNPIVMECRGLILRKSDNKVLCRSFDRFWNYGEDPKSDEFDIRYASVDEKVDGSLLSVYHDDDKWRVCTRKMAFAEGPVPNKKMTYADIFADALGGDPNDVFKEIHKDLVIIFEMVSPETRVVTPYKERKVYLLEVRDRISGTFYGRELTYNWPMPEGAKWRYPKMYKFESWKDIIRSSEDLPAMEEGYIAYIDSWRIKIKNPAYLAIAHLRDNGAVTEKRVVRLVWMQDHEEYLLHFPEDRKEFDPYIKAYERMLEDIKYTWKDTKDIKDQKQFALAIKYCHAKGLLFQMRKGERLSGLLETDRFTDNYKINLLKGYLKK
jgi:hypothetical protein